MAKNHPYLVGLDIGTTKIVCIIGEATPEGDIDIIGLGQYPSRGLRKGVVVNIDGTVESIKSAVEEAELMAGCEIDSVFVGIAGGHINSLNSHGIIAVKGKEIDQSDVDRVIEAAKAIAIPLDREVVHVLPQEFIVDNQDGIKTPLGMAGVRLEAKVHIVTAAVTSAQNIVRCVNKAGLEVQDIVLEQLASSESVLSSDEKELGAALIDIGGGTSDLAIFYQGSIKHTSVLTIAGSQMTNDIAIGLRTPNDEAEKIKHNYGCALASQVGEDEMIEVSSMGGRESKKISRQILSEIIEARAREMFEILNNEITSSGFREIISSGIVLTGGAACMQGMSELAEEVFQLPVRVGSPVRLGGLVDVVNNPMYATSTGLLQYGLRAYKTGTNRDLKGRHLFDKIFSRMKDWADEFF
ncbi:MAG: cell division protein FtsA [Candidatus Nitrohelix vancouverensis]|uniref:Cell division protein FtsA n=1 Tax=Candidatus Nitrohelix vancouverensis TaxID=2705534 RepID=A0A7T0G4Q8_9BACT|nr:MAG: cell division protein FtsA [Candidatus Nitrohelix vancouverensis]